MQCWHKPRDRSGHPPANDAALQELHTQPITRCMADRSPGKATTTLTLWTQVTTLPRQHSHLNPSSRRKVGIARISTIMVSGREQGSCPHGASGAQSIAVMIARDAGPGIEKWRSSCLGTRRARKRQQMPEIPGQEMILPVDQKKP